MTILALDVGDARIGIAISDRTRLLATPLGAVSRGPDDLDEILGIAHDNGADEIVVGLPLTLDGRSGPQAAKVRGFVRDLRERTDMVIHMIDERLSTVQANRLLRESPRRAARGDRGRIDAAAAAVILQSYLDSAR